MDIFRMDLDVLISGCNIAMSCLVTGYNNTRIISKVANATILQGVELIAVFPSKFFTHLFPTTVELVCIISVFSRNKTFPEKIELARLF